MTSSLLFKSGPVSGLPANPGPNFIRMFSDEVDGQLKFRDSVGNITSLGSPPGFSAPVRCATAAPLPSSNYASGVLTAAPNGVLVVDGVSPSIGDSVLVRNEAISNRNGVYVVTSPGSVSTHWVLTRRPDMPHGGSPKSATIVACGPGGSANGNAIFLLSTLDPIVIGTTSISFSGIVGSGGGGTVLLTPRTDTNILVSNSVSPGGPILKPGAIPVRISATPYTGSLIQVVVNGISTASIGDADKAADFYFSGDSGVTARAIAGISATDTLHVGTSLSYQLSNPDVVDLIYQVSL